MTTFELPKTYLEGISAAARENILRFFSGNPRNRDWKNHLKLDELLDLAHVEHPLRKIAIDVVTLLEITQGSAAQRNTLLKAYGPQCSSITLLGLLTANDHATAWATVSQCVRAEFLEVSTANHNHLLPFVKEFFRTPKPDLKKIVLGSALEISNSVKAVAENTGGLQEVTISGPRIFRRHLVELASANPFLEVIRITLSKWSDHRQENADYCIWYMLDIISSFSGCTQLRSLSLNGSCLAFGKSKEISDECVPMRHSNVSVLFNGMEYN